MPLHAYLEFKPGDPVWVSYHAATFAGYVLSTDRRRSEPYYVGTVDLKRQHTGLLVEEIHGGGLWAVGSVHVRKPLAPLASESRVLVG